MVFSEDLLDAVLLCSAALAQDSPQEPHVYLNEVRNRLYAYLSTAQRRIDDEYTAEKKYLPEVKLILE